MSERLGIANLYKSFSTPVLKGVNLSIKAGEIHALTGENGAGKSTMMNILSGLLAFEEGTLNLNGKPYRPRHARDAFSAGISPAAQELSLVETLTVGENIALRSLPVNRVAINYSALNQRARELLDYVGLKHIHSEQPADSLNLSEMQLVEIAKALTRDCQLLILDEPTAALTGPQADHLHKVMHELAAKGVSIIYISHRLDDVRAVANTVSVLRDGQVVITAPSEKMTVPDMITHMSGQEITPTITSTSVDNQQLKLRVKHLTTKDLPTPLDIECYSGEIVGIAGLAGSGRTELLSAIYGLTPAKSGSIQYWDKSGKEHRIRSPHQAVKLGLGFLPEERKTQGIFAPLSLSANLTLASLKKALTASGIISSTKEQTATQEYITRLGIKCRGTEESIERLSGGNQQKVLIGRWLYSNAELLLLDEPTRGVDVGAKHTIHKVLQDLKGRNKCILAVSSEIEELMTLCDRILVISNKKLVANLQRGQWSYNKILEAAFSEYNEHDK